GNDVIESRLSIGKRSSLIEDHSTAPGDLLQHRGVLDDDAALRSQRNSADDGDRNSQQQRARRSDDHHGQKPEWVAAVRPRKRRDPEREGCVPGPQAIGHAPQAWPLLLGFLHDTHNAGVSRINWKLLSSDGETAIAVNCTGEYFGAEGLRDHVGLTCQIWLIHRAIASCDN